MSEIITFQQMQQSYEGEWLLIAYATLDENLQVKEGEVLAHSPNQEEIYHALASVPEQLLAIEYVGQVPEDLAYIL